MRFLNLHQVVCCVVPWLVLSSGCALLNKAEPLTPRYFSLEQPGITESRGARPGVEREASAIKPRVRLGEVQAASHLEARMAYRVNQSELGYHEDRRWTEEPQDYLRRELTRQLFEQRHVRRVFAGDAPTLDVELIAFEEITGAAPLVRLTARYGLRTDRESLSAGTVTVERALPRGDKERSRDVAVELGAALSSAVGQICDQVLSELSTPEVPPSDLAAGERR